MKRGQIILAVLGILLGGSALADAEKVNVDSIREKYWARGDESELGVVQNRTYSKEGKIDVGVLGGSVSNDPFLDVKMVGGTVGYHLSELLSVEFLGWKYLSSASSALETFQRERGATTNTNEPKYFLGLEAAVSPIYGKLSLIGKAILYYDLHVLGGVGRTSTETGAYLSGISGIGQQIYLTKALALRIDYRPIFYREQIVEKVIPTKVGQVVDTRWSWNHTIALGATLMLGI